MAEPEELLNCATFVKRFFTRSASKQYKFS